MLVFPNIDDIVIIIDSCRKFQPALINLVEFHIYVFMFYVHAIIANEY